MVACAPSPLTKVKKVPFILSLKTDLRSVDPRILGRAKRRSVFRLPFFWAKLPHLKK